MNLFQKIFSNSISARLITLFLAISLLPIVIIGILSLNIASTSLEEQQFVKLETVGELKKEEVLHFVENLFIPVEVLSKSEDVKKAYELLKNYHDSGGSLSNGGFKVTGSEYNSIRQKIHPFFDVFLKNFNYDDVYFICEQHGHVMYSSRQGPALGSNLERGQSQSSQLAMLWNAIKSTKTKHMVDYSISQTTNEPEMYLGAPVFDADGDLIAIIAVKVNSHEINKIMTNNVGLGETGESYLLGEDLLMRTESRYTNESSVMNLKVETESAINGLNEQTGVNIIKDYRGVEVLSYYTPLSLNERPEINFDWVLLVEIDKSEAMEPIANLKRGILLFGIIIVCFVIVIALFMSRTLTRPIKRITNAVVKASIGDYSTSLKIERSDEIGVLAKSITRVQNSMQEKAEQAIQISDGNLNLEVIPLSDKDTMGHAFKIMVQNLRDQMNAISKVVALLTSSNSQLMSTIAQLSSSSNETATTVSEVSTTIEEVKQTAEVTTNKAQSVASTAQKSVQYSESGIKSTEDTVEGMHLIQEHVQKIAETIIKLSEQSQTIADITNAVKDIAEQSNLLAVNASIEAVKAGEYGKGFGVVAQEIRALADQSKQSAIQIKDILNDVQKAISSAVMATEQGGKAVDKGMKLTELAGDAISMLADSISEASISSTQIAASSNQQLTGMEQLATAMENIKMAATQNASGTRQAEEAVSNIKSIVSNLTELMNNYKIN